MESKHSTKPGQNRWGSWYVMASVMGSALARGWISPEVVGGQWKAMVVYVTGLMTQTNITATNLAQEIGEVSHDAISRMLAGARWSLTVGICLAIRVIEQIGSEGWLIVDDVLIPKVFGREIAFCGWDHDHTQNRTVFGQRVVFVVWSNGWLTIPVAFALWQQDPNRKPKPKNKGGKRGWPKGKKRGPLKRLRPLFKGCVNTPGFSNYLLGLTVSAAPERSVSLAISKPSTCSPKKNFNASARKPVN